MTIEEKVFHLQTAAMEEARAEGNAIIKQHEDALYSVFEQHCEEARRQSETRIKAEEVSARQQLNMTASRAQLELKREVSRVQSELKQKLFEEVEELLQEYMKTEAYRQLLADYIEKAASFADGDEMTIYINPSDADKKEYLETCTGREVTVSREDFGGGIRAVLKNRNILIDHAFRGAMEREYQRFVFRGGDLGA